MNWFAWWSARLVYTEREIKTRLGWRRLTTDVGPHRMPNLNKTYARPKTFYLGPSDVKLNWKCVLGHNIDSVKNDVVSRGVNIMIETECQSHRESSSALSNTIGFKHSPQIDNLGKKKALGFMHGMRQRLSLYCAALQMCRKSTKI